MKRHLEVQLNSYSSTNPFSIVFCGFNFHSPFSRLTDNRLSRGLSYEILNLQGQCGWPLRLSKIYVLFVLDCNDVGNKTEQCKQVRVRDNDITYMLNFSFLVTSVSRSRSASREHKTVSILMMKLTLK